MIDARACFCCEIMMMIAMIVMTLILILILIVMMIKNLFWPGLPGLCHWSSFTTLLVVANKQ